MQPEDQGREQPQDQEQISETAQGENQVDQVVDPQPSTAATKRGRHAKAKTKQRTPADAPQATSAELLEYRATVITSKLRVKGHLMKNVLGGLKRLEI